MGMVYEILQTGTNKYHRLCIKCLHGIVNGDHVSLPPLTYIQVNIQPSRHHPRPLSSQGYSRWVAGQLFSVSNSVYVSASAIM